MSTALVSMARAPLPSPPLPPPAADPVRGAIGHLLSRGYSLPCSTAAQAFIQLVQPTSRFQLALDVLLPLLDPHAPSEVRSQADMLPAADDDGPERQAAQRILVSFILYYLYSPHPIAINPFKSALFVTFIAEREKAVNAASVGDVSPNEQLVWVLWKILKGDGSDIGPYSPSTLATSPLPPKLRATNLLLDNTLYVNETDLNDFTQDSQRNINTNTPTTTVTAETDSANERVAHAIKLLLDARKRVLSLSEQRIVLPSMASVASARLITPFDLPSIVTHNPTLAHPLFVALLSTTTSADAADLSLPSPFLDVLPTLPPTLPSFDLMGRLLRDPTTAADGTTSVADLVRSEVLGRFILECINWLDHAEIQEKEGLVNDDRFAMGVQHLCRFYTSLIKLGIVDPMSDEDTAEMSHFSLRHSRFEEANALYRMLAAVRM
ncbi:hypothetical protein BDZ89DRAFT_1140856 [Hymenopellis radicata]|nr:hypothetical protein BDZ89DRAFT_1140856 [Hymenopellis radicata]